MEVIAGMRVRGLSAVLLALCCCGCQPASQQSMGRPAPGDDAALPRDRILVEETDPALSFGGGWVHADSADRWSGGTAARAAGPEASMSFGFTGTRVHWLGRRAPDAGIARVYLDNVLAGEVDLYSPAAAVREPVFSGEVSGGGMHTLTIEAAGAANPAATGTGVIVDAFEIESYGGVFTPAVAIRSPSTGAVVAGLIAVYAEAGAASGVAGVQFMLDGATLGAELTELPYAITWDTETADDGSHTLAALARHADGQTSYSPTVSLTVANGGSPPVWTQCLSMDD